MVRLYQSQKFEGFSTIELLIAFAIATIFLSGAAVLAFGGQTAGLDVSLTNGGIHSALTQLRDAVASTSKNWNEEPTPRPVDFYEQENELSNVSPCLKKIQSTTTWTTEHIRAQYARFSTYLGNAEEALAFGGGCDPFPVEDAWDNPVSLGAVDVADIDGGTDIVVRSIHATKYAFVTASVSESPEKGDFVVVDVSDAQSPVVVGTPLHTGDGLNGLVVVDAYAYVIQDTHTNQLQVINISNPKLPYVLKTAYTLPLITCIPHAQNCQSTPRSIFYYDGYVYIGTGYMAGNSPEFHVYCIADTDVYGCSAATPVWMGSLNVNHNINDIAVRGDNAFLATSADYGELTIIDIANKNSPTLPPSYSNQTVNNRKYNTIASNGNASTEDGWSVYVTGDYVYLGRARVNSSTEYDFYILDISDVTSVVPVGRRRLEIGNTTYVSGIVVQDTLAFVATTDSDKSLFTISLVNPNNPTDVSACGLIFPQDIRGLTYADNQLFTVNKSNDLLHILYDQPSSCI